MQTLPRDHDDFICAPDGKHAHFIAPTIDISDEIECGPHLDEDLIEAEDDSGAFKLLLETEEDVVTLEESRYMISRPLCLCAESADLLEQGLRVFPGLALYDGTWERGRRGHFVLRDEIRHDPLIGDFKSPYIRKTVSEKPPFDTRMTPGAILARLLGRAAPQGHWGGETKPTHMSRVCCGKCAAD